jgi:hypothetical protein
VRTAFAVLHSETSEQVAVDMDYHRAMFELSQRVNPKESIVGWCALPHKPCGSARTLTRLCGKQVLNRIEFEHLFGFDSELLLARNCAISCYPYRS